MSDHSPVHITVNPNLNRDRGRYSWKFNNSLLKDVKFTTDIRSHFEKTKSDLQELTNPHLKWEFFKYQARKFSIAFSKKKIGWERRAELQNAFETINFDYTDQMKDQKTSTNHSI